MTTTAPDPVASFRERNEQIRASLNSRGRIQVLPPDAADADLNYAAEKADYDGREG